MEDVLDDGEVALAALEQDAEVGEVLAAVLPRWPTHGHRVVPPRRLGGNSKGLKFGPKNCPKMATKGFKKRTDV